MFTHLRKAGRFRCVLANLSFITSAKEVMFLPVFVCLCVCVYKITQKVMDGSF